MSFPRTSHVSHPPYCAEEFSTHQLLFFKTHNGQWIKLWWLNLGWCQRGNWIGLLRWMLFVDQATEQDYEKDKLITGNSSLLACYIICFLSPNFISSTSPSVSRRNRTQRNIFSIFIFVWIRPFIKNNHFQAAVGTEFTQILMPFVVADIKDNDEPMVINHKCIINKLPSFSHCNLIWN